MIKKLFNWIINTYSYGQIYVFICTLFLVSLIPIAYFWIKTHMVQIRLIEEQLAELKEERVLEKFFIEVQQHRLLTQRFLEGDKSSFNEIHALEKQMQIDLEQAVEKGQLNEQSQNSQSILWARVDPVLLKTQWEEIIQKLPHLSAQQNEIAHTAFLHTLVIQFQYLGDRIGLSYFKEIDKYVLIQSIFMRLASIQENLSQLVMLCEKIILDPSKPRPIERMNSLVVLIETDLLNYKQGISLHSQHASEENDKEHAEIIAQLTEYYTSIENLIETIQAKILNPPKPEIDLLDFQLIAKSALDKGFKLWETGLEILQKIFYREKNYIFERLFYVLLITFLLTSFAIFLGLALISTGIKRLSKLTEATETFTNGDLSVRVPDPYQDQIGRQAWAFNRMAHKLEAMIKHLYDLLEATSSLAKGDLTARIQSHNQDEEFNQVAQSFNTMAETFERIIGRLQKIGRMLTTSASGIASASKDQETIVVQQESTTKEISIAASEISSRAKEFAKTMNEVSQAAERTSDLAVSGKESLTHMETIMRTMVQASSDIAAKLAILNGKAGNITSFITTITKVADQTNLLSLNASIEAEKAGEYGRSFAVIAREIRRLADQTAGSTLDIENMVSEIMAAVASSVMGVDDFTQQIKKGAEAVRSVGEQLAIIIEQFQAFTARFETVNKGMQAQSMGAAQINQSIAELTQSAGQTTEAIHQFHKTVQELNQAANELSILNPFSSPND